ncbi:unnamed protein product [Staurois parvus]|uniref:Uncharacterized protein n=1 Tax=Staurois parvus TaxID=386267 RepID=A0ABN9B0H6_9NEOB|nr:unnamed protein product [Staurois parvus]
MTLLSPGSPLTFLSALSVSPISASPCRLSVPVSAPINASQCSLSVPVSAAYQCQSVAHKSASQCRLSVPVSTTYQCHLSVPYTNAAFQCP